MPRTAQGPRAPRAGPLRTTAASVPGRWGGVVCATCHPLGRPHLPDAEVAATPRRQRRHQPVRLPRRRGASRRSPGSTMCSRNLATAEPRSAGRRATTTAARMSTTACRIGAHASCSAAPSAPAEPAKSPAPRALGGRHANSASLSHSGGEGGHEKRPTPTGSPGARARPTHPQPRQRAPHGAQALRAAQGSR